MVSQGEVYSVSCPDNDALIRCGFVPGKDFDFFPRAEADLAALCCLPHKEVSKWCYSFSAGGSWPLVTHSCTSSQQQSQEKKRGLLPTSPVLNTLNHIATAEVPVGLVEVFQFFPRLSWLFSV